MFDLTAETEINASSDVVWETISNPALYPEISDVTDRMISVPDDEFGYGYVYEEYGGVPPFKAESRWEVTRYNPKSRQVHIGDDGSTKTILTFEFKPTNNGTHVIQKIRLKPPWYQLPIFYVMWLLFMRKRGQAALDKTVSNLKQVAERSISTQNAS
jgi:hypothetical protein